MSKLGYHVLLFNARGVGGSSGWASWTAFQEGTDLKELVSYLIRELGPVDDVALVVRYAFFQRRLHSLSSPGLFQRLFVNILPPCTTPAYTNVAHLYFLPSGGTRVADTLQWPDIPGATGRTCATTQLPSAAHLWRQGRVHGRDILRDVDQSFTRCISRGCEHTR